MYVCEHCNAYSLHLTHFINIFSTILLTKLVLYNSVEQHQAATKDFGCSREVLFLGGSFSMVNGGGDFFAGGESLRGSRSLEVPLMEVIRYTV